MPKIAVHLHLYYVSQLDDLLQRLKSFTEIPYDLFVTMVSENTTAKQKINAFNPNAKIWIVPNFGYDIGPFIDFLHKIELDDYDYIVKIHTKRTYNDKYCIFNSHRFDMNTWREMLLDAVISSQAVVNNLKLLDNLPQIGILSNKYIITDESWTYENLNDQIASEMVKIGLKMPKDKHFIVGTMFWARAKLLKPFLQYKITDFSISDEDKHDGTLAHIIERMLSLAITSQGYQIKGVCYKSFNWLFLKASIKRFLFQKKTTRKGKFIIKICKIPVYYRKD